MLFQLNISQKQPIVFLLPHLKPVVFTTSSQSSSLHHGLFISFIKKVENTCCKKKWFSGDDEKIENFLHEASRKTINNPKLISFN